MIMASKALLDRNPRPSRDEIIDALTGNYCRCTGYERSSGPYRKPPVEWMAARSREEEG